MCIRDSYQLTFRGNGGMYIHIESDRNVSVAQYLAQGFWVAPKGYTAGRKSVPQGVEVNPSHSCITQYGIKSVLICARFKAVPFASRQ